MTWRFSRQLWLYLASVFTFGLSQAFLALFLNFYLRALGLGNEWQGLINALPALTLGLLSLPAVALARRISNAYTLRWGAVLSVIGTLLLTVSPSASWIIVATLLQGAGSALTAVASSPFMANNSDEHNRVSLFSLQNALMTGAGFVGNLLGGQWPHWYAHWSGSGPHDLSTLRLALGLAALLQALGLLPLLAVRPSGKPAREGRSFTVRDKPMMARLVLPNVLVGLGAGATIPFLNVFIEGKFQISYAQLGSLFAWTSLATATAALIQPAVVRVLGQLPTILLVQASSLPFLALLGFAPELWMVTLALFTRGALMNAAGPTYSAYAMTALPPADRPMYSAVNTLAWDFAWAASSIASGLVRARFPFEQAFQWLFAWTLFMYVLGVLAIYGGLYRRSKVSAQEMG